MATFVRLGRNFPTRGAVHVGVTPMHRRGTTEAYVRFAHARATLVLAVLLVCAGLMRSSDRAAESSMAAQGRQIGQSVGEPSRPAAAPHMAFVRPLARAINRVQPPTRSTDGGRGADIAGTPTTHPNHASHHVRGALVEARARGVAGPGQPAPSSRAPPSLAEHSL